MPLCGVSPQGAFSPPGVRVAGRPCPLAVPAWTARGRAVNIGCFRDSWRSALGLLDLPRDERPRERLALLGAGALSSRELLAALLGTGARGASALDLAGDLLGSGLRSLASRSLQELEQVRGLGRAKATRVLAALELGARLASDPGCAAPALQSPGEAARYLLPRYATRPVETFGLLALDARHRLRREAVVSVGCLTASLVHPREVFQEAVVSRAAALVLFHNHPSGDPEPSAEDLALTRRLVAAGSLMGIEVLDHLVLGAGRYVSLKDRGVL
jgi:DNA repair protein RadC